MPEIGATLREARMRERIDVSEIEAKTKIRAKYLRALENEEWDLLPGPTFVKTFLRTYAQALGLDDKALLEEYKLSFEHPGDIGEFERSKLGQQPTTAAARYRNRIAQRPRTAGGGARGGGAVPRSGPSRGYLAAVAGVGLLIVLLLVGLLSGGSGPTKSTAGNPAGKPARKSSAGAGGAAHGHARAPSAADLASLKLEPTAEVYVCLIGDGGRKRIPGVILKPGVTEPEYHARRFLLTLGNNALTLIVNGKPQAVPASAQAIGYSITRTAVTPLEPGELPTCT
jgi:cytoskeleton protein RodZ